MPELTEVIMAAATDAGALEGVDPGDLTTTEDATSESTTEDATTDATVVAATRTGEESQAATTPAVTKPDEPVVGQAEPPDDIDKELAAQGINAPPKGKDNQMPHSAVKRIVGTALRRAEETHKVAFGQVTEKVTRYEEQAKALANVEKLISTDADRYIGMLAAIHPNLYRKFLHGGATEGKAEPATEPAKPESAAGPMPEPDVQYTDGSTGYSPKGLQKLLEWNASVAEARATARVEQLYKGKFGIVDTLTKEREAQAALAKLAPAIHAQVERAKATWGEHFPKEDSPEGQALLTFVKTNPSLPFEAAVSTFLLPRIKSTLTADEAKVREKILKEMNARPAAASTTVASQAKVESTGTKSVEDIVRESAASLM